MAEATVEDRFLENQDKALLPIREDIAEWLSKLLDREIKQESLFDDLQTGTLLCHTAHVMCQKADELSRLENENVNNNRGHGDMGRPLSIRKFTKYTVKSKLPRPPKFSPKAQPGSFLARDNAANFITWCRELGVQDTCIFESEGLVLQKQKRNVLLCLLEVARLASKYGIAPPELIRLERDIELDERQHCDLLKNAKSEQEAVLIRTPPTMHRRKRAKVINLDKAVHKIVDSELFHGQIDIERIGEGRYRIESRLVFIRMLRNRHVMVRVGGGWDTLEHYLLTHASGHSTSPQVKLLSYTDYIESDLPRSTPHRKFHQIRTRIPLRSKQC